MMGLKLRLLRLATLALAVRRSLATRPDLIYIQLTDEIIALLQSVDFLCDENEGLIVIGTFFFQRSADF
jgi:hypothetical protein